MRIKKIHIVAFGKLKDYSIDFSDKVNIIYGENEAGKSTIINFIKAMLYGFRGRSKDLRENHRKRYMPIDGVNGEGSMEVEKDGITYIIKRKFGKTAAGDSVSFINAMTSEKIEVADIGIYLLGVNDLVFSASLCIGQLGSVIRDEDSGELVSKLSNIEQTGDEDVSYKNVINTLNELEKNLNSTRKANSIIPSLKNEILELEGKLHNAKAINEEYISEKIALKDIEEKETDISSKIQAIQTKYEKAKQLELYIQYKKAKQNYENTLNKQETISAELDALKKIVLENESVREWADKIDIIAMKKSRLDDMKKRKNELSSLNDLEIKRNTLLEQEKKYKLISVVSFVLFFLVVTLFVGIWAMLKTREVNNQITILDNDILHLKQSYEALKDIDNLQNELQNIFHNTNTTNFDEFKQKIEIYAQNKNKADILEKQLEFINETLQVQNKELEQKTLLVQKDGVILGFEKTDIIENEVNLEEVEKELEKNKDALSQTNRIKAQINERLNIKYNNVPSVELLQMEYDEKKELLARYNRKLEILKIIRSSLEECFLKLQTNFAPLLNKRVALILSEITDGKYNRVQISKEMDINVGERLVESAYLSNGTYDLLYFAIRLAITEFIIADKKMLIFDDPFLQYDDKRTKLVVDFIMKLDMQILLFTCKEQIVQLAKNDENNELKFLAIG